MSDRGSDPTEPIDRPREPTVTVRRNSTAVGNAIAILLVLAIGGAMAAGAIRNLVPSFRGATGASPSPTASAEPSATFTLRPLPSFTPTPSPSPSPTPTRTATPTPRPTPTPVPSPRTPAPPRTPTPTPTR